MYPWGNTYPGLTSGFAIYGCYFAGGSGDASGTCSGVANIAPVGLIVGGNGKYGQADLAGNVWEWAQDWYVSPYSITNCDDCADLTMSRPAGTWSKRSDAVMAARGLKALPLRSTR